MNLSMEPELVACQKSETRHNKIVSVVLMNHFKSVYVYETTELI